MKDTMMEATTISSGYITLPHYDTMGGISDSGRGITEGGFDGVIVTAIEISD